MASNQPGRPSNSLSPLFGGRRASLYPLLKLVRVDCCNSAELFVCGEPEALQARYYY
jgi:hypothetical protein